ncbi:MAG: sulfatase-like hydrolase/transferase [Acidobacteria bacterium]|nr:sulfatase-like hydrolase/transferase [Acidobacteriota bacterium]
MLLRIALVAALFTLSLPAQKPNVLILLADDLGTVDVNVFGAKDLHTPNLNRLARRGVRFTQFYVGAPVCSPSRASLLTGRVPQRAGVPGNVGIDAVGMPSEQITMAEMLGDAGYQTGLIGKWHLGHVNGDGPLDQGFRYFYGFKRGCIDNYSHFFYWVGPNVHDLWQGNREIYHEGEYFPDQMVHEIKEFLLQSRDKPFFLYAPFNIPHYPVQGTAAWRDYYKQAFEQKEMPENRYHYAALVSTLDEKIGEVLDFLDELHLTENTLIVFLSDHGHSTEERAMFGGGSAGPYRGAKFSLFEGGIRVPAIVSWPGEFPADESRDQFATSLDILPMVAELTGASLPADHSIDGKSLLPLVKDKQAASQHQAFHWQQGDQWAVREGDWKLVVNARDTDRTPVEGADKTFLSNMAQDATERRNIASDHPDVVERLTKLHEVWQRDANAH